MRWRDSGFVLPFGLALLPVLSVRLVASGASPGLAAWLPLGVIFGVLPLIDALLGSDTSDSADDGAVPGARSVALGALPLLALPVWLATLLFCAHAFAGFASAPLAALGWILSTGILGGILAINPAHELIHRTGAFERACGGALLASVGYHGFKIEHVRGHHVHVATPQDGSTARLGASVYAFVPRALARNARNAWLLEAQRLRAAGGSPFSPRNEMLGWTALWLLFVTLVGAAFGAGAALFCMLAGIGAAASLEVINYIEHYGLERAPLADGRYERVSHLHSWNASQRLSNWLLFNLQRHSDHHAHARRPYPALRHRDDSPQLPAGYATMYLLALVPPLWRRVMDPRARQARLRAASSPAFERAART